MNKKVIIGCDHAAVEVKNQLVKYLESEGYEVTDSGTYTADSCDYPAEAHKVCLRIQSGEFEKGILLCGTGIGISIAANKHKGIFAALCTDEFTAQMCRQHNGANVVCMGARVTDFEMMKKIADIFLTTEPLNEGRHERRRSELRALDNGTFSEETVEG